MPGISIQFYALPEELLLFVKEAMQDFQLHAVAMRFRPFEVREFEIADLDDCFADSSGFRRWSFTLDEPVFPVKDQLDHADKHPDLLGLDVGKRTSAGLEESWLNCRTTNLSAFEVWKKLARRLKKITLCGVTRTNRKTGVRVEYRNCRYTLGAKTLEDLGVAMLPHVGPHGPPTKLGLLLTQAKKESNPPG